MSTKPILQVKDLEVTFEVLVKGKILSKPAELYAVNKVSFDLFSGETLGIVGESGCGKSTLARAILRLLEDNSEVKGNIIWKGQDISHLSPKEMQPLRKDIQVIFQDRLASLDPRMTIFEIIAEPLKVYEPKLTKEEVLAKVKKTMKLVGLNEGMMYRYPHEFSGGQNQRVGIARAIILKPKLLVCDEAVSALDVSIKSQIINLLQDLKKQLGMSLLFISHDLSIIKYISDRIMVLYLGEVMELATSEDIYAAPLHPYTKALISAVPIPDPEIEKNKPRLELQGDIPSPFDVNKGCPFASRCPIVGAVCWNTRPELRLINNTLVACHKALDPENKSLA